MTDPAVTIRGARVMDVDGRFAARPVHLTADGRFGAAGSAFAEVQWDATGLWMIPGVYDCHGHLTWNDFHAEQRDRKSEPQRETETAAALRATLHAGVTNLRDAGGADARPREDVADGRLAGPRLQVSIDMIGAAHAGTADSVRRHVEATLAKGADWIKLVATAGVATPGDAVLQSNFTEAEIRSAVDTARRGGARVMMHTWGGDSADWAIEHGVTSIEHGIYLTDAQLTAAAAAGMTLVPTLTVYRYVRDMVVAGELGGVPLDRITDVVATHERIIRPAFAAGLPIAVGTDFSTPQQHGTNLVEIAALMRAGLPPRAALLAATENGARLFEDDHDDGGGRITPLRRADAVLLAADPHDPATFDQPAAVAAVLKDGRLVHLDRRRWPAGP